MNPFLKPSLQGLVAYHAEHITQGIKLDANENAYGLPEALKDKLMGLDLSRYPDSDSTVLVKKLATVYEVEPENVVCGVGSDQLIDCLIRGAVEQGDKTLTPEPSFSMYKLTTELNGGCHVGVPLTEDFLYDVETFIEAIQKEQPRIVFICNPNNPTGSYLELSEIERIVKATAGIVVIDEAYSEFAGETAIPLVKKYNHVIVFKTFSKAYALAGARIGYGIGSKDLIDLIYTIKPPYNVNVFSQEAALMILEHREMFVPIIKKLCEEREKLYLGLKEIGFKVYPSYANFLWVEPSLPLEELLRKEKLYIRKLGYNGKPYYRISVGTQEENLLLLEKLKVAKERE